MAYRSLDGIATVPYCCAVLWPCLSLFFPSPPRSSFVLLCKRPYDPRSKACATVLLIIPRLPMLCLLSVSYSLPTYPSESNYLPPEVVSSGSTRLSGSLAEVRTGARMCSGIWQYRKGGPLAGIPRKIVASGGANILLLGVDRVILTR